METSVSISKKTRKKRTVQYDRWGYFFIAPFFIIYVLFSLIPLLTTFVYSFFENYKIGLDTVGPNFKVYKYFTGLEEDYEWEFDEIPMAIDDYFADYDGDTLSLELKEEIIAAIEEVDGTIDLELYEKDLEKLLQKDIDDGKTVQTFVEDSKNLVFKKIPAISRNISIVFNKDDNMARYFMNTLIMWILGFIPQIIVSLLLAVWFTNTELKLKFQQFFKKVIYMPNLIMAAAFSMLFFAMFSPTGPVNGLIANMYTKLHASELAAGNAAIEPIRFFNSTAWTRTLVATMNFLMWYGNTTILLMAGVMGIDNSIFEAARIDGASSFKTFFRITLPLLKPIFVYVLITSLIGGIQMFDVPQILTNGKGTPNRTTMTIIMKLNNHLFSRNYGPAGITSVIIFTITGILSGIVYKSTMKNYENKR